MLIISLSPQVAFIHVSLVFHIHEGLAETIRHLLVVEFIAFRKRNHELSQKCREDVLFRFLKPVVSAEFSEVFRLGLVDDSCSNLLDRVVVIEVDSIEAFLVDLE